MRGQARLAGARAAPSACWTGFPPRSKKMLPARGCPCPGGTALPGPRVPAANAPITDRILEGGGVIMGSTTDATVGHALLRRLELARGDPQCLEPGLDDGRLQRRSRCGRRGGIRPPARRYGYRWVYSSARNLARPGHYQTQRRPSTAGRALYRPGRRPDGPHGSRRCAPNDELAQRDIRDYTARPYPPMNWLDPDGGIGGRVIRGMKVALQTDAGAGSDSDSEVLAAVEAVAQVFARAGAEVTRLGAFINQDMLDGLDNFWRTRSWADYSALPPDHQELVLPYIIQWCSRGASFDGASTIRHFNCIDQMQKATIAATARFDVVLSPVAPMPAFAAEQPMPVDDPDSTMAHIAFTVPFNMSGTTRRHGQLRLYLRWPSHRSAVGGPGGRGRPDPAHRCLVRIRAPGVSGAELGGAGLGRDCSEHHSRRIASEAIRAARAPPTEQNG